MTTYSVQYETPLHVENVQVTADEFEVTEKGWLVFYSGPIPVAAYRSPLSVYARPERDVDDAE